MPLDNKLGYFADKGGKQNDAGSRTYQKSGEWDVRSFAGVTSGIALHLWLKDCSFTVSLVDQALTSVVENLIP